MIAKDINTTEIATEWLSGLDKAASSGNIEQFTQHFLPNGWLRDALCFSWDFHSLETRANIASYLAEPLAESTRFSTVGLHELTLDTTSTLGGPSTFPIPGVEGALGVQGAFRFTLREPSARGRGFFRLVPSQEGYKALTVYMTMYDLIGHEEPTERPRGIPLDATKMTTWEEDREAEVEAIESDPTVVIVGGGQGGLMAAARFRRMGIRALVIEKTPRVGDVWRNRYPTLSLHLPNYSSSFLYQPYPKNFPEYIGRTQLANFMESYAIQQELTIWTSSTVQSDPSPTFDPETKRWTVVVNRAGNNVTLKPKHLVLAMGSGMPYIPEIPGQEKFKGEVYHSDFHKGAKQHKGKKVVVVGAGNAAADVCQDFVSKGAASTTLVQRSATALGTLKTSTARVMENYPETRDLEDADLIANSLPPRFLVQMSAARIDEAKKADAELIKNLEDKGFKFHWTYKGQGVILFLYEKLAGSTMLDTGITDLIIGGHVNIKQGVEPSHFEENALVFNDGSKLEADVVVLATGNQPPMSNIEALMSPEVAAKVGTVWGLDGAGELRKAWRPTGQQGLWVFPGGFATARYHSRHVALQILAEELGIKTPTPGYPVA